MEIGGEKIRNSSEQQGENERHWKKKKNEQKQKQQVSGEHIRHFLHTMCNYEVSCCSRPEQRQKDVQKNVLQV